jgi:diguanylate cyclase (GGDEF)-like protein/PAS domain S-box-containing protein
MSTSEELHPPTTLAASTVMLPLQQQLRQLQRELEQQSEELSRGQIEREQERKRSEDELRVATAAFESQTATVVTDPQGKILRVNAAFTRLTGYSAQEAVGQAIALLKSGRHDRLFYQTMWASLLAQQVWQGEIWSRRKGGQDGVVSLHIAAITAPELGTTHYIGHFSDISMEKEAEALIHRLAYYDTLTHLPNRRLLRDRLTQALASSARSGRFGAYFLIDIDHFKLLNDTAGREVGDQLLVKLADRLSALVREADTVARQAGDEFVVLLPELAATEQEALARARAMGVKLKAAVAEPIRFRGFDYACKLNIGVVLFRADTTVEELFTHADLALQHAKTAARNTLQFFSPSMRSALDQRSILVAELQMALKWCQFCLYYQPQVDSAQRVVGVEALLRWQHPLRGLVSPIEFIPLAEDTGLILPIGLWVLQNACAQLKLWQDQPKLQALQMAVNVSARQFGQADFVAQVQAALTHSGANPARLKLELTESLVLENVRDVIEKMHAIKRLGVSFSMDDFGTGYSSLSNLAQLPIDQLKIDKSFVQNIPGKNNDETIARTIISMGHGLNIDVIAEGVETQVQREFLERHGCHAYQGYLFSRPLPLEQLEAYVGQL